ncbi:hypothetical protein GCM10027271_41040 [Saccharopolyspora gloriosae]|uniref:Chlorophyllase-like protein n=1 Tax=Saccharopolyspora gloriosae TaxID=455344 RepID=A0A840NFH7_9PSEU|nr:hypothetical protein [Saccharopolyspora gloriosae]MBB5069013.1 hypothetical protein [Saccharopolyspora gloriosae]
MRNHVRIALAATALCAALATACSPAAPPTPTAPVPEPALPTVREATAGLPGHTVYRPADLAEYPDGGVPLIAWGNGACSTSNLTISGYLTGLAAHGYIVIANGAPEAQPVRTEPGTTLARPDLLTAGIDWALDTTASGQQLHGKADPKRVAVAGTSCGGIEALLAGADPRVRSVVGLNTGFSTTPRFGGHDRGRLAALHSPTLLLNGGPTDVAYDNSRGDFAAITVPAALVEATKAGHSGISRGISEGDGDQPMLAAGLRVTTEWLRFTLDDDQQAKSRFLGPDCGWCTTPNWTVTTRNF